MSEQEGKEKEVREKIVSKKGKRVRKAWKGKELEERIKDKLGKKEMKIVRDNKEETKTKRQVFFRSRRQRNEV